MRGCPAPPLLLLLALSQDQACAMLAGRFLLLGSVLQSVCRHRALAHHLCIVRRASIVRCCQARPEIRQRHPSGAPAQHASASCLSNRLFLEESKRWLRVRALLY
jgi:hypothetical protein